MVVLKIITLRWTHCNLVIDGFLAWFGLALLCLASFCIDVLSKQIVSKLSASFTLNYNDSSEYRLRKSSRGVLLFSFPSISITIFRLENHATTLKIRMKIRGWRGRSRKENMKYIYKVNALISRGPQDRKRNLSPQIFRTFTLWMN